MASEKRLIPCGEKVTLYDLPFGAMFAYGDDCIAVKSEYACGNGLIEAFIIDSGEQFWGGAKTAKEQNELMVQPLEIVDVDAVEVVHGHWILKIDMVSSFLSGCEEMFSECSVCHSAEISGSNYCPNCGAKMDGGKDNGKTD